MNIKELKKDVNKSVRINSEILKLLQKLDITVQDILDNKLNAIINIKVGIDKNIAVKINRD